MLNDYFSIKHGIHRQVGRRFDRRKLQLFRPSRFVYCRDFPGDGSVVAASGVLEEIHLPARASRLALDRQLSMDRSRFRTNQCQFHQDWEKVPSGYVYADSVLGKVSPGALIVVLNI